MKPALAQCLALSACSSQPQPATAPTGPYHYESTEGGVVIDSTVNVRYDRDAAVVDEDVQFGHWTANVESRLDPKTFSAIAYTMRNDPEEEDPSIAISTSGALVKTKTAAQVLAKAPVPGAPSWVFGNYASSYIMLRSLVRVTHPKTVNAYMTTAYRAFALKLFVIPTTAAPPAGAPYGGYVAQPALTRLRKELKALPQWRGSMG